MKVNSFLSALHSNELGFQSFKFMETCSMANVSTTTALRALQRTCVGSSGCRGSWAQGLLGTSSGYWTSVPTLGLLSVTDQEERSGL